MEGTLFGLITFAALLLRSKIRKSESRHKLAWDIALAAGASGLISVLTYLLETELFSDMARALRPEKPETWLILACVMVPFALIGVLPTILIASKWKRLPEEKPDEFIDTGNGLIAADNADAKRDFLDKL